MKNYGNIIFLKKNNLTLFFSFFSFFFFYIRNPIIKISLKKKTQISKEISIEYSEEKKISLFLQFLNSKLSQK